MQKCKSKYIEDYPKWFSGTDIVCATLVDEYFFIQQNFEKRCGEKTIVLLENAPSYEIYGMHTETEKITPIEDVANILKLAVTKKNKSLPHVDRSNPRLICFYSSSLDKYQTILLENHYTVVVVDQIEKDKSNEKLHFMRRITLLDSLGLQIQPTGNDSNYFMTMIVRDGVVPVGVV